MGVPVSQVRQLYLNLVACPYLKNIRVLLGSRHMARAGAPPRIVLFPKGGPIQPRAIRDTQNVAGVTVPGQGAIRDVKRIMIAHLWAASGEGSDQHFDAMEDLYNRFFQAMDFQATGGLPNNASAVPGNFWESIEESWDVTEDTAKQGEEVYIAFSFYVATTPAPLTVGTVNSTSLGTLSTTLSALMTPNDTTATVTSTAGFPNTGGILSIDSEQIQYQGIVGNQFIGLVRGVNGTVAVSHNNGSTVNVS